MDSSKPRTKNELLMYIFSFVVVMGSFVMGYSLVCLTMLERQITLKNNLTSEEQPIYLSIATTTFPLGCLITSMMYKRFSA